jgi:hypothetical protein
VNVAFHKHLKDKLMYYKVLSTFNLFKEYINKAIFEKYRLLNKCNKLNCN